MYYMSSSCSEKFHLHNHKKHSVMNDVANLRTPCVDDLRVLGSCLKKCKKFRLLDCRDGTDSRINTATQQDFPTLTTAASGSKNIVQNPLCVIIRHNVTSIH